MDSVLIVHQEDKFVKIVDNISSILEKKGIKTYHRERSCLTSDCHEGNDLIIVVGGDGTFLRASHLNLDRPIFGINPDPEKKEGFFMQATSHDYEKKLDSVLEGDFKIIEMLRLQAEINGKKIEEISLNEIFIGDKKPYNMFNYFIELGKEREFQRGSGILIATPAGSNAWMKAAGGVVMDKADMR